MSKWLLSTVCCFVLFVFIICIIRIEVSSYEYVDLDDNKGLAKKCFFETYRYHAGGQGSPVCILEDGTVIQVKQYKLIDVKYCMIWEENCMR